MKFFRRFGIGRRQQSVKSVVSVFRQDFLVLRAYRLVFRGIAVRIVVKQGVDIEPRSPADDGNFTF